jgi:hypothetical protein
MPTDLHRLQKLRDFVFATQSATTRNAGVDEIRSRTLVAERRPECRDAGADAEMRGVVWDARSLEQGSRDGQQIWIALNLESGPTAHLRRASVGANDDARADGLRRSVVLERD